MVNCAVVNCIHRTDKYRRDDKNGLRFFSIPKIITTQCDLTRRRSERRRALWISRINRKDLQEADIKAHTKVCSAHFIKGAPSALFDENNPDWAPSQNLGYSSVTSSGVLSSARHQRTQQRAAKKRVATTSIDLPSGSAVNCSFDEEPALTPVQQPYQENLESVGENGAFEVQCADPDLNPVETEPPCADVADPQDAVFQLEELRKQHSDITEKYSSMCFRSRELRDQVTNLEVDKLELQTSLEMAKKDAEVLREQMKKTEEELRIKTEMLADKTKFFEEVQRKNEEYMNEAEELREEVMDACVKTFTDFNTFINDEAKVRFYTGLPSSAVFQVLLNGVVSYFKEQSVDTSRYVLQPWQCLLLTLMRLRLALIHQDLAYRFGVSKATSVRVFERYIDAMYESVYPALVRWPDRETLWETMPREFRESYGNSVAVIIDCFEIFTDKPSSLETRASIWSNYKHHHTVKILVGISPTGAVIFVSTAWGARASDKHVVQESGLYELLLPHDVVMADRGFNIAEHLALHRAKLLIPAFTRGQDQLSSHDVSLTRKIANLRIHVERVIGLVRRKFRILRSILPVELLTSRNAGDFAPIDKIVRVCCALVNMCPSIVVHPDVHEEMDVSIEEECD